MDGTSKRFGLRVLSTSAAVALTLAGCSAGAADVEPAASSAASSEAPASTQDFSEAALIDHSIFLVFTSPSTANMSSRELRRYLRT